ncbi:hypothetical protein [Enhygromyxa salina]|nr:hypothetical protein [Enhygromyxa salina]
MSEEQWSVFHKIGNECSLDEFSDFVANGELPLVELSKEQLESVAGGNKPRKVVVVSNPHDWPS